MDVTVEESECGQYRYQLTCRWDDGPLCGWVLLNPSAGERALQPTRSRCIAFAKAWGYSGIVQRNRFAFRNTSPAGLLAAAKRGIDLQGDNLTWLCRIEEPVTVAAWGASPAARLAPPLPDGLDLHCIGINRDGSPRHPLHAPARITLQRFYFGASTG